MTRYIPPSIDKYGGISMYLIKTRDKHNGYDSVDLIKCWNWGKGRHMNITSLAIMFGVSWFTMKDWLIRLHKEAGKPLLKSMEKKD